jgi:hypothetical protein
LEYYHAKCVGLEKLKEKECADKYSNCKDGTSYACPNCCKLIDKNNLRSTAQGGKVFGSGLRKISVGSEENNEGASKEDENAVQSDNELDNIFDDIFDQNEEITFQETCDEYGNNSPYSRRSSDSFNFINEVEDMP